MLISMAAPALALLAILLVPGFLALRSCRLPRTWALCCAPAVSCGIIAVLGEGFAILGVSASAPTVLLPAAQRALWEWAYSGYSGPSPVFRQK